MKKITIFQENSENIILFDDDHNKTSLLDYTKKITEILESTNICILETSSQIISLKPSKLNSILVTEVEDDSKLEKEITQPVDVIKD
jgi:methylglyoxal synthase